MARPGVQVRFSAASFAGLQTHRSGLPAKHSAVTSTLNFDPQPSDSSTTLWERGGVHGRVNARSLRGEPTRNEARSRTRQANVKASQRASLRGNQ
jgi:hypothetical protein